MCKTLVFMNWPQRGHLSGSELVCEIIRQNSASCTGEGSVRPYVNDNDGGGGLHFGMVVACDAIAMQ